MTALVLVGPPGALVAEVAALLSERHQMPYVTTDDVIEAVTGTPISDVAVYGGADDMRTLERSVAVALLHDLEDGRILALGSGCLGQSVADEFFAPVRTELVRARDEGAVVVHLTGDFSALVRRVGLDGPRIASVSSPRKIFYQQLQVRTPLYAAVASYTVDTTGLDAAGAASLVSDGVLTRPA